MTNAKHTPGPWSSSVNGFGTVKVEASGFDTFDGSVVLATMSRNADVSYESEKANARLIAAAPELLEALKELKEWIGDECGAELPSDKADAAIAKAEG